MPTPAPQLDLFDKGPPPAQWLAHPGPWYGRTMAWTRPDMPGLAVRHCGHPTALYPYYVTIGQSMEARDPHPLRTLAEAKAAAVTLWQQLDRHAAPA